MQPVFVLNRISADIPALTPAKWSWYSVWRPRSDERLSWPSNCCSDPSGPVNSCKFLYFCSCPVLSHISFVVLYFPVFLFITVLGCINSFTLEVQRVFSVKRYLHQLVSVDCSWVWYYYYYYAAFNAPCVGHKDDESVCSEIRSWRT